MGRPGEYESHITFDTKYVDAVRTAPGDFPGWKFSRMENDPVLGDGHYCYLTSHDSDYWALEDEMHRVARAMKMAGVPPMRKKIEKVLHDTVY